MKSVGAMIDQLVALLGTADLTPWEQTFVSDIDARTGMIYSHSAKARYTIALSPRTVEKIAQIYAKHFGDAEKA